MKNFFSIMSNLQTHYHFQLDVHSSYPKILMVYKMQLLKISMLDSGICTNHSQPKQIWETQIDSFFLNEWPTWLIGQIRLFRSKPPTHKVPSNHIFITISSASSYPYGPVPLPDVSSTSIAHHTRTLHGPSYIPRWTITHHIKYAYSFVYNIKMTHIGYKSDYELTKDTPQRARMGKLWSVHCEYFEKDCCVIKMAKCTMKPHFYKITSASHYPCGIPVAIPPSKSSHPLQQPTTQGPILSHNISPGGWQLITYRQTSDIKCTKF